MINNSAFVPDGEEFIPSENSQVNQEMRRLNSNVVTGQAPINVHSEYKEVAYQTTHVPQHTFVHQPLFSTPGLVETYTDTILTRNVPATSTLSSNITGPTVEVKDLSSKQLVKEEKIIEKNLPGHAGYVGSTIGTTPLGTTAAPVDATTTSYVGTTTVPVVTTTSYVGTVIPGTTATVSPAFVEDRTGPSPQVTVEDLSQRKLEKEEKIIDKHLPGAAGFVETQVPLTQTVQTVQTSTVPIQTTTVAETVVGGGIVTEEYMKNSSTINRTQDVAVSQSQWEQQQTELASMRYENHSTFESWEKNRSLFFGDRLSVMDNLMAGMERQIQWLDAGFEKTVLFFKERESQELEFARTVKHSLPQLGQHFSSVNRPDAVTELSQGLQQTDDFHAKQMQNAEVMGQFIKKDILDWTLLPSEKNYKESSAALRVPMTHTRKKLDHLASKRHRAYDKYAKLYDTIQKSTTAPTPKDGGLFKRQLKYSLAAREELRVLRLYDEQGLTAINEFAKLSMTRLENLQKAFTLYYQKYNELNRDLIQAPEPVLGLIQKSNTPEAINTLFQPVSLLTPEMYKFAVERLHADPITYADLNTFLVNFPDSIDPARSSFVLKEWEAVKQGGLLKKPRLVNLIATTNNSLLIVEKKHEERETGIVKDPMQLRYTRVENVAAAEDGTTLKVVERTPGRIFDHTHSARLKFNNTESAQEFLQFVNNQTTGDV